MNIVEELQRIASDLELGRVAGMKRPGPYLQIQGKRGLYKVTRMSDDVAPRRSYDAWGEITKVTKSGKPTGRPFDVQFRPGKISVDWKRNRRYLSASYTEVSL